MRSFLLVLSVWFAALVSRFRAQPPAPVAPTVAPTVPAAPLPVVPVVPAMVTLRCSRAGCSCLLSGEPFAVMLASRVFRWRREPAGWFCGCCPSERAAVCSRCEQPSASPTCAACEAFEQSAGVC